MNISKEAKMRQSNFELLRIILMILVLLVHANFPANGALTSAQILSNPLGALLTAEMQAISMLGVDTFILISGYFLIKPTLKSLSNFFFTYYFWSIGLYIVSILYTGQINVAMLIQVLNPLFYNWFIGAYLGLCVFSHVLNVYIDSVEKTAFKKFLIIYLSCMIFIGWVMWGWPVRSISFNGGFSLLSFIGIYLTGAYIRKYVEVARVRTSILILVIIAATIIASLLYMGSKLIGANILSDNMKGALLCNYDSPFTIIGSISLFIIFAKLNFKSRIVNRVAKSAFVIFIVHLHPFVLPAFLSGSQWIFGKFDYFMRFPIVICYAVIIYLVCALIDQIRIYLWDKIAGMAYKNTSRQPLA